MPRDPASEQLAQWKATSGNEKQVCVLGCSDAVTSRREWSYTFGNSLQCSGCKASLVSAMLTAFFPV
jgi:hypothetical protein